MKPEFLLIREVGSFKKVYEQQSLVIAYDLDTWYSSQCDIVH